MTLKEALKTAPLYMDGGTGTLLQAAGLPAGTPTESWNLTHPEVLVAIHRAYYDAGSNIVATNTFGVNPMKMPADEVDKNVAAAVANAKRARETSTGGQEKFVTLDIGPLGRLLAPLGDCDFEDAVAAFAAVVKAGVRAGVDGILIETMNDCYETKAALLAAKENSTLPVLVSNAYGEDGRLMSGADPAVMTAMLEGMGADAIGVNCSLGPKALSPVVRQYLALASVPVICKPNAGLPRVENGVTVYDVTPDDFAREMAALVGEGVRLVGGCCGTTPDYIRALIRETAGMTPAAPTKKTKTVVTSGIRTVDFDDTPVLIGERINPTGKKRLKQALSDGDMDYILGEGIRQQEAGAAVLDVNVGAPEIDEKTMLPRVAGELQAVTDLPLQLDSADPVAMERALRRYNGKALVNSVNGKEESMRAVFPLVKKYGGVVVALTLDENGIPETADGRVAIAEKILAAAEIYGIDKKDIIFDPLTLTVSADGNAANVTLEALRTIRRSLGCHTSLGVSNVSFGLPSRAGVNGVFFTMALENGLSAAIMNPYSAEMMTACYGWRMLRGLDENCLGYIGYAEVNAPDAPLAPAAGTAVTLADAVVRGLRDQAGKTARELLVSREPMALVQEEIIPALNRVGADFEAKKVFLPQLLMSAEAAGAAFEEIKAAVASGGKQAETGCRVVLATVRGDIHDIGKNIVRLLLENYGFAVTDLGRDVPPEKIAETAVALHAPLVGLSALMTTTVPAMEETIRLLHREAPFTKVVVGGAVLTADYAEAIGADAYAKDAMETVRYAQSLS